MEVTMIEKLFSPKREARLNIKTYEEPIVDIIILNSADILTSSTDAFDGVWVPIGGSKYTSYPNY